MVDFLARRLWWAMLWFMRRPAIRSLQRKSIQLWPEGRREQAWNHLRSQEAWARRHGLALVRFVLTLLSLSVGLTLAWLATLEMINRGWIPVN